jgi:hypothetical protein
MGRRETGERREVGRERERYPVFHLPLLLGGELACEAEV